MSSAQKPHDVTFRRTSPADAELLTALAIRSKAHWSYPKEWLDHWRPELTILSNYIQQNHVIIAHHRSQILGFFALEFLAPTSARLQHLWIDPPFIGKGFGRLLFEHACATAKNTGRQTLEIVSDPNAEPFYLHMGAIHIADEPSEILDIARTLPKMVYRL